jgi:hypothetical protein
MARPAGRGLPHERARLAVAGSRLYSLAPGPLTARQTSPRRRLGILLGASAIGLGYGWIAHQTSSVAAVDPVHALTDSCGVRPARTIWLGHPGANHPS